MFQNVRIFRKMLEKNQNAGKCYFMSWNTRKHIPEVLESVRNVVSKSKNVEKCIETISASESQEELVTPKE